MAFTTPIAYVVFNRPEHTRRSFARIRDQQPTQLFIIADGPRSDHEQDSNLCAEVRSIADSIDWPCEVHRDFAQENLGLKRRVSTGLEWVFSKTDRAIVLEDDCLAHPDFFRFCDALLRRYASDPRVAVVTGDNFQEGIRRGSASYYFSKYSHVWGWATWKRVWDDYDVGISFWQAWKSSEEWLELFPDPVERRYWERILDQVSGGRIDTWDYQLTASVWRSGGLTATPNVNLVTNIGFDRTATHTKSLPPGYRAEQERLGPLVHPPAIEVDREADRLVFDKHFGGDSLRDRRRPLGFLRWLASGTARAAGRWVLGSPAGGPSD